MKRRLAIKRLTRSDLTIFEYHFRTIDAGNQKSINLNADVFIKALYPGLEEIAEERSDSQFLLNLTILGPGLEHAHTLPQKVLKGGSYKNWRLNGKMIPNPDESPNRYNALKPNDFAVLEFTGAAMPTGVRMTLVAADVSEDSSLHAEIFSRFGSQAMVAIEPDTLNEIVESIRPSLADEHPILDFLDDADLEDAVQGGNEGKRRLRKRRRARGITKEEYARAQKAAEVTGANGEEILNFHFENLKQSGLLEDYEWNSDVSPFSPYDFSLVQETTVVRRLDAKSTRGAFESRVHISLGELREAAEGEIPYDIYRLYELGTGFARLRIAKDIKSKAEEILRVLSSLPGAISVDGVALDPRWLDFGPEELIDQREESEQLG
ncbi:MAG: hypothetical protein ACC700_17485 [Anaerolineales bacterium]